MKFAPSTRAKDNMHADGSDIQIPSKYENAAMQATEYITSHDASQRKKNLQE